MRTDDWQREMERYLAHFSRYGKRPSIVFTPQPHTTAAWTPAVDMFETDASIVILLDLAGVDPEKTDLQAEGHVLVVRGVRHERHGPSAEDAQRSYHTLEIPYGHFERRLHLPPGTDTAAASANYADGILEINVPKRLPRQVPISTDTPP